MLDHHIQRTIVTDLKSADEISFTNLKPPELDNKLFTYHLKIVIREGFVRKNEKGAYSLTSEGKKLWRRMSEKTKTVSERAISVLFIIIRDTHGRWLMYRRKSHPLIEKIGFMHALPNHSMSVTESATGQVFRLTGLDCSLQVIGSGYFRIYLGESLESYTNFTVLMCENVSGELSPNDQYAEYFWEQNPDFTDKDMLPNMKILSDKYLARKFPFFVDEQVYL